jgi:RES domain-containing protein
MAAYKGFKALDTVAHVLTALSADPGRVHLVQPAAVPNPNWLHPGISSAGQQQFGDVLLAAHAFVVIPSAVSTNSWNLIFVAAVAVRAYVQRSQEPFALPPAVP